MDIIPFGADENLIEMMNNRLYRMGTKKISLLESMIFLLALVYGFSRIEYFESSKLFQIMNLSVQLLGYAVLIYLIIKKPFKKRYFKYVVLSALILLVGFAEARGTGWIRTFFIILASRDRDYKKVIVPILQAFVITFICSILLFVLGVSSTGAFRRDAISLGFVHPNVAAITITTIYFIWIAIRNKVDSLVYGAGVALMIGNYFTMKTNALYIAIFLFWCFYLVVARGIKKNSKFIKLTACGFQIFFFGITYLSLIIYPLKIYDRFRYKIDMLLSWRPYLNYDVYREYGITLFGKNMGQSGTRYVYNYTMNMETNQLAGALDSTYLMQMVTLGLVPMTVLFVVYILVIKKAWDNHYTTLIAISMVCCIYAFVESGYNEAYYFFPLFYLMTVKDKDIGKGISNDT